jgi:TRAP-type C4-dicarboxylate transport system substrate-binding protein
MLVALTLEGMGKGLCLIFGKLERRKAMRAVNRSAGGIIPVVILAVLAVLMAWPAGSVAQTTLTYANFPPAPSFPCVQMERWADEVEKRTGGQVTVQTFPGSTLLNPKNMFDGVVSGVADIGCLAMSYQPGRFPVSEAVDLPLGFTSAEVASMTLFDIIQKYQPEEFEAVKIITLFTCPPTSFMTSKPIRTLEDLEGFELRVSGTTVDMINRLGGAPVAMPMSETPDAIQKGVVKGIVSSMEILKDFNFAAYCPFATRANLNVVTFAVVMNKDKYNALPEDVRQVIDDLYEEQSRWTGQYVDQHVEEALAWAKEKYDHELIEFAPADKKKIEQLLEPIVTDYINRVTETGLPAKQIVADVMTFKAKHEAEKAK